MRETAKQKNEEVNKILKDAGKSDKFYWKRTGKCCWKTCQSACCRFSTQKSINKKAKSNWQAMGDYQHVPNLQFRSLNGYDFYIIPRLCPHISFDGKCDLHNKKTQPRVCQYFPMHPRDGTYIALKHICGYKFKKIKNKKIVKRKLPTEEIK